MSVFHYPEDDIDTDLLLPGRYTSTCSTGPGIAPHPLEGLDPTFAERVREGER